MPRDTEMGTDDDMRNEFENLKNQVNDLMNSIKNQGEHKANKIMEKVGSKLEDYEQKASSKAHDIYDAGSEGIDSINAQIRKNPLMSLVIAFGTGYVLSRMLTRD